MSTVSFRTILVAMLVLLVAFAAPAKEKIKIEKLDDLPRHTYTIDIPATELFSNDKALMDLAAEVKKDLENDLATYEITDATTLKGYFHNLGTIALLEGDYDTYRSMLEKRKKLEDKEAARLTKGLFALAYIDAKQSGKKGDKLKKEIQKRYAAMVNPLPYEIVGDELKSAKGSSEIINESLVIGMIQSQVQPVLDQSGGEMSKDMATGLLSQAYALKVYIPNASIVTEVLAAYIDEHHVDKPDIWADRDFDLAQGEGRNEVRIGIWDSGVDAPIFKSTMWVNPEEVPGNGKDDDGNGYVDDVHGIAYDLDSNPVPELLYPIGAIDERPLLQSQTKGLLDLQANIDSKEAQDLKKTLKGMQPQDVNPFLEGLSKYGNYSHGTHVAGIAVRGNPYVRVVAARMTYSHKSIPPEPTLEKARKDSAMMRDVVQYFQDNGVRVVNMSWGESLGGVEAALEMNNAGGTPEERKELARQIFEISKGGLYAAIKGAPEIFFVTSAGNSDNDVNFEEFIPSSFDLPNIISVGAVDQAGDETGFTSFGKVDVYANGFEVDSYVPGGDRIPFSGTSMSSPNVVNLAAKLLAVDPTLTPSELRSLIIDAGEERKAGDRTVLLMHPKASLKMLKEQMAS